MQNGIVFLLNALVFVSCKETTPSNGPIISNEPFKPVFTQVWNPGQINTVYVGPSGNIYAGTMESLFKSSDDGLSWTRCNIPSDKISVDCICEPISGTVFVGSGGCSQQIGVIRSTDNGVTWTIVNEGLTDYCMNTITFKPPNMLFAGTAYHIYRSSDNGDSWVAARSSGVYWKMVYCIFALDTVNILAGIGAGLYRSSNNGDSWMPIDTIDSYRSIAQTNNGIILTVCSPYSHPGLSRSTDLGTHWNYLTTGLWNEWTYQVMTGSGGIAYVLGRYQIARTKDNGDSWSVSDSVQSNFISIALAKDGKLIAGGSNGFYISTNAP